MSVPEAPAPSNRVLWAEVAGWYGTIAIVLSYVAVIFKAMSAQSMLYDLLNLTGALGLAAISWVKRVRQNVLLNAFWAAVAVVALLVAAVRH